MTTIRHYPTLYLIALVTLLASVFFFSRTTSAQSYEDPLPIRTNEQIIEDKKKSIEQKNNILISSNEEIKTLVSKKESLTIDLQNIRAEVDNMRQHLESKRIAAEAERKRVEYLNSMFVHINRYADDASGNTYEWGNCTWGVKNWRPDISNSWGNANTWFSRAQAQGWSVGDMPKKGAVGTSTRGEYGHVVYVTSISLNSDMIGIKEMNSSGLGEITNKIVDYHTFKYIYELD